MHRRGRRRGVRADRDAADLRRPQDGRHRPHARGAAAVGRRRRAHDRARQLGRPAPRHEGGQHRRADHGAGRSEDARPDHGRAGPSDRRARPGRRRALDVDPPQRADVRGAVAVAGAARDRHQGDRPHLPVREGRQDRPLRRRRRRQDRHDDGAHQQHRHGALGTVRCSRASASARARATTSITR